MRIAVTILFLIAASGSPSCSSPLPFEELKGRPAAVYDLLGSHPPKPGDFPNEVLPPDTTYLLFESGTPTPLKLEGLLSEIQHSLATTILILGTGQNAAETKRRADLVHAFLPGVRAAVFGSFPARRLVEVVDIYIPPEAQLSDQEYSEHNSLLRLRDCVDAVRQRKHQSRYQDLLKRSEEILSEQVGVVRLPERATDSARQTRLLTLKRLLADFEPLTEPFEKWDKGAMSLGRAAEVRIARQTARHRRSLYQRHIEACSSLGRQPLSREAWSDLWPQRVLFSQDFENPPTEAHDWMGEIETDNLPAGSSRALAGIDGSPHFARRTRTGIYFDNARAAETTWVKFDYFLDREVPLGVFVFNMTQSDNWAFSIDEPITGSWTTVTLDLKTFTKKGGGDARIEAGDALDDVFVHAGVPADQGLTLIIDNVELIGLDF